ncbi:MAG TPA: PIN domain-containing protein [Armatimonadota bacterium]|jgi:hypothetical protein
MPADRLFLDTACILARVNAADKYHASAEALAARVRLAAEVWTTEAILVEVGDALSATNRMAAARFIESCYATPNVRIVPMDTAILRKALSLYGSRLDKDWGLTDCISFIAMAEHGLTEAATPDRHFVQAGFKTLLASS